MDPKQSSSLDPKLQEAYDRVMGTSTGVPADSSTPAATAPSDPTASTPPTPSDTPTTPPMTPSDPAVTPVADPSSSPSAPTDNIPPITLPTDNPTPVSPASDAPATPPMPPEIPTTPTTDTPAMPTPPEPTIESQEVVETPEPAPTTSMENTASVKSQAFVSKKGMKVSPVILAVGGIAFLLVYTLVWVKVFNLQLPFLPQ